MLKRKNLIIDTLLKQDQKGTNSGSAFIFEKNKNNNNWIQIKKLIASDGIDEDRFGRSVDIKDNLAIVGSERDDDNGIDSGSVYIFEYNDINSWIQTSKLLSNDGESGDNFGNSLLIYSDNIIFIGSKYNNNNKGCVYIFEKNINNGNWSNI